MSEEKFKNAQTEISNAHWDFIFYLYKKNLFRNFFLEINVHFPFLMEKAMVQTQSGITGSF